jgi:LysR family hydrogen peroxide-inducible transcriptional activator
MPVLAVKPPVPRNDAIALLRFDGDPPRRQIAMVWRRSSAMAGFLAALAAVFRALPEGLLGTAEFGAPAPAAPARRRGAR